MHTTTLERPAAGVTEDISASPVPVETAATVRTDLRAGLGVLAVVIGGHLAWQATGAGFVATLLGG